MLGMATVLVNEVLGAPEEGLRRLVLRGVNGARPGQFLHIQVSAHLEPLLRRPISIAAIDSRREEVTLFYRVQGRGTQILSEVGPGGKLNILGPLGRGFSLPVQQENQPRQAAGELWLVAGGIGVFPLLSVAQEAVNQGVAVRLFWGGNHKQFFDSAGLSYWEDLGIPLHLASLDGSAGSKGMVTDALDKYMETGAYRQENSEEGSGEDSTESVRNGFNQPPVIQVATCGPRGMMQAVAERCLPLSIPLEVSLEERMGCGVGACLGCAVTVRAYDGSLQHKKACQDGPVFRGEEVVWDV